MFHKWIETIYEGEVEGKQFARGRKEWRNNSLDFRRELINEREEEKGITVIGEQYYKIIN